MPWLFLMLELVCLRYLQPLVDQISMAQLHSITRYYNKNNMAKKKILLGSILFSVFSISILLIPASCSKTKVDMKDIANLITDRDVGDEGSEIPSEEQL
jgi:hypothetical protein